MPASRFAVVGGAAAPPRRWSPRAAAVSRAPLRLLRRRRRPGERGWPASCGARCGSCPNPNLMRARAARRRERVQPAQGVRGGREERAGHHLHRRDRLHRAQAREDAGASCGPNPTLSPRERIMRTCTGLNCEALDCIHGVWGVRSGVTRRQSRPSAHKGRTGFTIACAVGRRVRWSVASYRSC